MPNMDIDADASVIWHLLLDAKLATEDQLEEAYEESAQYNQPFVNILYNFDIITEDQLLQLIAENLGTAVYSFHKHEISNCQCSFILCSDIRSWTYFKYRYDRFTL